MKHWGVWKTAAIDVLTEPQFVDACEHGAECYVGSARIYKALAARDRDCCIDVYIHDDNVCIRQSDEPSDYRTPGTILDLIVLVAEHQMPEHSAALQLIDLKYDVEFKKKEA